MRNKEATALFKPVFVIIVLLIPYIIVFYIVNYKTTLKYFASVDYWVLIGYLITYLVSVVLTRVFTIVTYRKSDQKSVSYFSLVEIILILTVFLILASLFVYPMSFVLIMAPLKNNIIIHLFLLSIAPLILFHLKNRVNRQTET